MQVQTYRSPVSLPEADAKILEKPLFFSDILWYNVLNYYICRRNFPMTIKKTVNGSQLTIALEGRMDTTTAPQLEAELKSSLGGITELVFDFAQLKYISSAGLRVLLSAQKVMNKQGSMVIHNACEDIIEIFDVTGFCDILTIE